MKGGDLPTLGLGCAQLGNLFHERSDEEARAVLDAAWEAGIRHFDTAPHYGLGLSERRLGSFLATKPREAYVVSTKVGRLLRDNPSWDGLAHDDQGFAVPARTLRLLDYTPTGVWASLEESLSRMGLDHVDILYVHDPERSGIPGATEQAMAGLAALRAEGMVSAIGTGSMAADAIAAAVRTGLADQVMVAGSYTLLDQSIAPEVLEACDQHDTRIVAAAVFNSGLLARRPNKRSTFDYAAAPAEILERAQAIDDVCTAHGVELPTAAMHFPLLDRRVASVVVGADSPAHVRDNVARLGVSVPGELWDDLDERGLVPRCA